MNITVIGVGKLGLGFALLLDNAGYNVLGVDIFQGYVDSINNKTYKTEEPEYNELMAKTKIKATTSLEEGLKHSDIIFIIVQTPNSGGDKFYDHSILSNLLFNINKHKVENKHIIVGCTVMPKYIDEVGNGLICDCKNTTLNYNPEFIAQGSIISDFRKPDIILIGTNSLELGEKLKEIYDKMFAEGHVTKYCILSPLEAELVKISINGFITTKLSFANMISDVCDNVGADKEKVLDSIGSDKRIGNKYFRPGNSFGGPCFPRDTKALKQCIDQNNINSDLLTATTKYNEEHIDFQVKQLLNLKLDDYLIENVCYKENSKIPLIEESAKLKIALYLYEKGKNIIIKDNLDTINEVKKEYGNKFTYIVI